MKDYTETHQRENNEASENHLQENQKKFSKQCLLILTIFYSGKRLTCKSAMNDHGIGHLPRRLADLRENGIAVKDEWVRDSSGKRLYKEFFLDISKRPTKEQVLEAFKKGEMTQSKLEMK